MKTLLVGLLLLSPSFALAAEEILLGEGQQRLKDGWKWVREDSEGWRVRDKALELRVLPGNMWGGRNNAKNVLIRPVSIPKNGALEVTTHVENRPTEQYEQVDLVFYYDDSHMVKIGQELVHGKLSVVMGREQGDRTRTIAIIPLKTYGVGLRYRVDADSIHGFFLPDGEKKWKEAGRCDLPRPKNGQPHISLQVYQGPKDKVRWARITHIEMEVVEQK